MKSGPLSEDDELQRFASSQANVAVMSVIVEVETPPISLVGSRSLGAARRGIDAVAASERSRVGAENLQRVLAELDASGALGSPTVIPAAHAVVASVTPEQLRRLIALPGIATIRRNRKVTERAV